MLPVKNIILSIIHLKKLFDINIYYLQRKINTFKVFSKKYQKKSKASVKYRCLFVFIF